MKEKQRQDRIVELEKEAIKKYIDEIEWDLVIEMLSEEEQREYWRLILEENPDNETAKDKLKVVV